MEKTLKKLFFLAVIIFSISSEKPALSATQSDPGPDCSQCIADFALYDPDDEEDGVWEEEVIALEAMFNKYGWTYQRIGAEQINKGSLGNGSSRKYRALVAPGGYASYRKVAVNRTGDKNIRNFISSGGNYVGFCAGSYWVVDTVSWAQNATGGDGTYNQSKDYKSYAYDLHLLNAVGQGPFGWSPWKDGTNPSLEVAMINTENPTMAAIKMPSSSRFFYYGGPFFTKFTAYPDNYEVWATTAKPEGTSMNASIGNGQPTIIHFSYGSGEVTLFSYHPDILIGSLVDHVVLKDYVYEDEIDWDTGTQTQDEINYYSWNIVHAALQIAANEEVSAIDPL